MSARLRLFSPFALLIILSAALGGTDFLIKSGMEGGSDLTLAIYVKSWAEEFSTARPTTVQANPEMAAFLPPLPEGWSRRDISTKDVLDLFPPEHRAKLNGPETSSNDPERRLAHAMATVERRGVQQVLVGYAKDDKQIMMRLVQYPDVFFTSIAMTSLRSELEVELADTDDKRFATLLGKAITEAQLPAGIGLRYFRTDVSGQYGLDIITHNIGSDAELADFLGQIDLEGMNKAAIVKDREISDYLGEKELVLESEIPAAKDPFTAIQVEQDYFSKYLLMQRGENCVINGRMKFCKVVTD